MKKFHRNSHFGGAAVHTWIGLSLVICFFISGLANAMHCDDALFRLKSCGISKAQLSRTGAPARSRPITLSLRPLKTTPSTRSISHRP